MGSIGASKGSSGKIVNNGKMIDYDAIESTFKEGKYNKTNAVPVYVHNANGGYELKTAEGYGTKVDGEVFYIQKRSNKDWVINYAGMVAGSGKSLAEAKEKLKSVAGSVKSMGEENRAYAKAMVDFLNNNGGRVSDKEMKAFRKEEQARQASNRGKRQVAEMKKGTK